MEHKQRSLKQSWELASDDLKANDLAAALTEALWAGRYSFAREAWHTDGGEMASELLLRAWDERGLQIRRGPAIAAIAADGSLPGLNSFLVFAALDKISPENGETLSINILPSVMAESAFWAELDEAMNGHDPANIIFEILEHENINALDDALMRAAIDKGFRFALDDFNGDDADWQRLATYAPYLEFVKIDGPVVRSGLEGDTMFVELLNRLDADYPDLAIIAEYVSSDEEAQALYDMGVTAVQGDALPPSKHATARPKP